MSSASPLLVVRNIVQQPSHLYTKARRRLFLCVLFLVGTCNYVDKNIIGVLLDQIKAEFHISDTMLGLLSGIAFALFYATLGIPVARWADRGDRKLIITLSLMIWSAMTVLCGFATGIGSLLAARFGVGMGEAGAIPPAQSLLADYYQPAERAQAIGFFMLSATAGYAIALILGGWVAQHYGWRAAFVVVGLSGIVIAPFTYFILKEPRQDPRLSVTPTQVESILVAGRRLFKKPAYRLVLASIVGYFVMAYGAMVFIVSLMIRAYGLSVSQAGATFGVISALGAIVGNLAGGLLADRLATRNIAWLTRLAGWGMMAATPLYELALHAPTINSMCPLLILATTLLWGVVPPMFSALHVICGSCRRAIAVAIAFFFANLIGLGLGPVVAGALSDILAVKHGSAEGLRYALMIVVVVFLPSGWLMLRAGEFLKADAEK